MASDRKYTICYTCRKIWCSSKNCESPKPECQEICLTCIDAWNVTFDFCGVCKKQMSDSFARQLRRKQLPPKLRYDNDDSEAQ